MKRLAFAAAALLAPLAIGIAALAASNPAENPGVDKDKGIQYDLKTLNNSGQKGTVRLKDAGGDKTEVIIALTGEDPAAVEPAHIHVGSCPTPGAVKWPLTNVVHGTSVTILDVPIGEINKAGFAVNVHESKANIMNYVACATITGS